METQQAWPKPPHDVVPLVQAVEVPLAAQTALVLELVTKVSQAPPAAMQTGEYDEL